MTHICITGSEKNPKSLQERIAHVLRSSPHLLCELRLDYLDLSPAAAFAFLVKLPPEWAPRLILTQRLRASGTAGNGQCAWDIDTWQSWWKDVMALRTWFAVDLDWLVLDRLAGESLNWRGRFRSRHAFFSLHASLDEIEHYLPELEVSAKQHNAGIKLATPVRGALDLARLARIAKSLGSHPLRTVVAMGAAGKAWRWSALTGSVSYFAYSADSRTAQGQDLFENVLAYLSPSPHRKIPDLYVLWSEDARNTLGEREWNRVFAKRSWNAHYVNIACSDAPARTAEIAEKKLWAEAALEWMESAGVNGASVTKPMKELFPLAFSEPIPRAVNTLKYTDTWSAADTDGPAVFELLCREAVGAGPVVVIGSGGAAQAVAATLEKKAVPVTVISRLPNGALPALPAAKVLLSTWPASEQEALVEQLAKQSAPFSLVLDAQFQLPETTAPLAQWAKKREIRYLHGSKWWRGQARGQDIFWFAEKRTRTLSEQLWPLFPGSKSETLRALAIAAFRPGKTKITHPAFCEDTELFLRALEELGLDCEKEGDSWIVRGGKSLVSSGNPLFLGEGAAPLRFLGAMSLLMEGDSLVLDAAPSLRRRPIGDLLEALQLPVGMEWPLSLPCHQALPQKLSVAKSSQFASGFLLAAAGLLWRKEHARIHYTLVGELRSAPYLELTLKMLREAGVGSEISENQISLFLESQAAAELEIGIEKDASALSYFELLAAHEGLGSLMHSAQQIGSGQADWRFAEMLPLFQREESVELSLKDAPDLAPTLFAAAIFYRRALRIREAPQLHDKECDRAGALVAAAQTLGLPAEDFADGFFVDARSFTPPRVALRLVTHGDHRLAMAFAVLGYLFPEIQPDNTACVAKSFPTFWQALQRFQELLP